MPPRRNTGPAGNAGTFVALLGLVIAAGGLLLLVMMVFPQAIGLVIVVFGFLFVGVFHYVVWGWWMSSILSDDDPDESAARSAGADPKD